METLLLYAVNVIVFYAVISSLLQFYRVAYKFKDTGRVRELNKRQRFVYSIIVQTLSNVQEYVIRHEHDFNAGNFAETLTPMVKRALLANTENQLENLLYAKAGIKEGFQFGEIEGPFTKFDVGVKFTVRW